MDGFSGNNSTWNILLRVKNVDSRLKSLKHKQHNCKIIIKAPNDQVIKKNICEIEHLQAPVVRKYLAKLSLTSFTCFFGSLQFSVNNDSTTLLGFRSNSQSTTLLGFRSATTPSNSYYTSLHIKVENRQSVARN